MNPKKRTVSVEDLLRVKRAERPPTEFWAEFDREMRIRQLAAIVEPRPWWAPLIRVGAKVSRYQVPIGAAAILAFSLVTIREYRGTEIPATFAPEMRAPVAVTATPEQPAPVVASEYDSEEPAAAPVVADAPAPAETAAAVAEVGRASHSIPLLGTVAEREPSPSERYIAENLAAAKAADPAIVDEVFGSPVRAIERHAEVRDPLIQVASLGDSRRSRLLTTALPPISGAGEISVGNSARVAQRLTEDRLYDSVSRIGVRGDRVAIKF